MRGKTSSCVYRYPDLPSRVQENKSDVMAGHSESTHLDEGSVKICEVGNFSRNAVNGTGGDSQSTGGSI